MVLFSFSEKHHIIISEKTFPFNVTLQIMLQMAERAAPMKQHRAIQMTLYNIDSIRNKVYFRKGTIDIWRVMWENLGSEQNPRKKAIESARRDKAKGHQTRRSRGGQKQKRR